MVAVGLMEGRREVEVELQGDFVDAEGRRLRSGRYRFLSAVELSPLDFERCSFTVGSVRVGAGFHWEREQQQVFRGKLRLVRDPEWTAINDVPIEEYVASVIASEMNAASPAELLKAHAVISRSWLVTRGRRRDGDGETPSPGEIIRWYGCEAHRVFDVCADDHCQRYHGIAMAGFAAARQAAAATSEEVLIFDGRVCDARFSKSCGGFTENYGSAWADRDVPYLRSVYDGPVPAPVLSPEEWIRSGGSAYCNMTDPELLGRVLARIDQETRDFFRWSVRYSAGELGAIVRSKLNLNLGAILDLEPLARGPSGRIVRLKIVGDAGALVVGKELEIRRVLSRSHLYSSAFTVTRDDTGFRLRGAGWGHGVGLCQVGASTMAALGKDYRAILAHYYSGAVIDELTDAVL